MLLPVFAVGLNLEVGQLVQHLAQDLDILAVDLLKHVIDAHRQNVGLDLVVLVKFDDQVHVSEHLLLEAELDLRLVEHVQHLLVELERTRGLVCVCLCVGLVHAGAARAAVFLLDLEHLVELLLAPGQQELAEIHLYVLLVVELLEEGDAEPDVDLHKALFSGALHKDDLHQLVQQRRGVLEVFQKLLLNHIEIAFRQLIEQDSDLADVPVELVDLRKRGLTELGLALLMGEVQKGHINGPLLVKLSQTEHELQTVDLFALGFGSFLLVLDSGLSDLHRVRQVTVLVPSEVGLRLFNFHGVGQLYRFDLRLGLIRA